MNLPEQRDALDATTRTYPKPLSGCANQFESGYRGGREMNAFALVFFASPEFVHTGRAALGILIFAALIPVFVLNAFWGMHVLLGVCQVTLLCAVEWVQWRFTRLASLPVKLISAVMAYCVSNLLFFVAAIFLMVHHWIPN